MAFVCFCMVSSADYLVNDISDIEADRAHPTKRNRPIAAGLLPVPTAWVAAVVLVRRRQRRRLRARLAAWASSSSPTRVLMLAYTYSLKHIVLIDLFVIAAGLRAARDGRRVRDRRADLAVAVRRDGAWRAVPRHQQAPRRAGAAASRAPKSHRKILDEYTIPMLDQMGSIVTGALLIAYGLYTFTAEGLPENHSMMLTIPFVLYGIFRYLYLVNVKKEGGAPEEVLLKDVPDHADSHRLGRRPRQSSSCSRGSSAHGRRSSRPRVTRRPQDRRRQGAARDERDHLPRPRFG